MPINMDDNNNINAHLELSGFKSVDSASMLMVRRVVDGSVKKFMENVNDFERLRVTLKEIHGTEKSVKYQVTANLIVGKNVESVETVDRNLLFALDSAMKKLEAIAGKL
ncbi:MAG: hypothetical protein ACMXYL_00840 [Candidatus Woesearchaeota archaeon]